MKLPRDLNRISRLEPYRYRRWAAYGACLKVHWNQRLHWESGPLHQTRLFGKRVNFRSARGLRFTFREIFLDLCYWFETKVENPVILDAGSNIGMATLFFKVFHPGARITCFEPDPAVFEILKRNVRDNDLEDVSLHQKALTGRRGSVALFPTRPGGGAITSINPARAAVPVEPVDVEGVRLSDFVDEPVDLLKLDVEGAESEVLADLDSTGKLAQVRLLMMEYHHHVEANDDALAQILDILQRNGFTYRLGAKHAWSHSVHAFQDVQITASRGC